MSASHSGILTAVLIAGVMLFIVGSIFLRDKQTAAAEATIAQWVQSIGYDEEAPVDAAARIEIVERLSLLGEPWCLETLRAAEREEQDPAVSRAISKALSALLPEVLGSPPDRAQ